MIQLSRERESDTIMSRLLRFSKLSHLSNVMKGSSFRWCSSSTTTKNPYLMYTISVKEIPDGSHKADGLLFDPAREKLFTVRDKSVPKDLLNSSLVGSSQGWGVFYDACDEELVRNVAMSSDSPEKEEDFVVAIKLPGSEIISLRLVSIDTVVTSRGLISNFLLPAWTTQTWLIRKQTNVFTSLVLEATACVHSTSMTTSTSVSYCFVTLLSFQCPSWSCSDHIPGKSIGWSLP
ncbi:PREDICTED: uncharacterized protein LOC104769226 [Camelina sativa]|uniref:Uncharacterized protein LOC104769226 n=1 Tax=Camelina sativa TaxID=90675 RepID=A0ABM0XVP7_CAMSA|nr:PREDICTED: uncharacterized protein LOC104769226 [Camelina sativa]